MPFEFGIDMGFRRSSDKRTDGKKFIIFEKDQYNLKEALSDLAGSDVEFHKDDPQLVIKKLRNFLSVEVGCALPGKTKLETDYYTFMGWMTEKKSQKDIQKQKRLNYRPKND